MRRPFNESHTCVSKGETIFVVWCSWHRDDVVNAVENIVQYVGVENVVEFCV